jgi:F-type H+-transporting ATPase subunit delta
MASSSPMQIAVRYAQAWFSSLPTKDIDSAWRDAEALDKAWQESAILRRIASSPLFTRSKQAECMLALAKPLSLQTLTVSWLQMLAQNRRLALLPEMIVAWKEMVNKQRGHVEVRVITASILAQAGRAKITTAIGLTLKKDVTVQFTVDPALIGGAMVKVGSHMLDASLKSRLEALHDICRQAVSSFSTNKV